MSSALSTETEKDVLPWLRLAEDLRLLDLDVELNMPQICVMGDQSSGKSSVLEALSGIPFPRGSGLVTRCPIRMVMKRARPGESWSAVVSTTSNSTQTSARDIPDLNAIMDRKMQELCGGANNFSTESVVVELISPDACDLTVVDLPGIIRTVTAGQNITAIEQVNRLIKNYLLDKRTIILAVIPANQDIATVDILERAQGVDPTGQRTIGVLTKTDLVGPGNEEEVLAVVNNIRKPLHLGYVMVKNRSQKEITENISAAKARENEIAFFANNPVFRKCNPNLRGVSQLSKKLTHLLVDRIKLELGPMKLLVERMLTEIRSQLRQMPSNIKVVKSTPERQKLLVSVTQEFVRHLNDCIRGEYRDRLMVRHVELRLYTLVMKKFMEFQTTINETAPNFKQEEYIQSLTKQIEQLRGRELPGFMSSQAFYMCMAQYVSAWEEPMEQIIKDVQIVAIQVAGRLAELLLGHYPVLQESLKNATEKVLQEATQKALVKLTEILQREKDPFTLNEFLQQWVNKLRFDRFSKAVEQAFEQAKNPASNWNGLKEEIYSSMRQWYRDTHAISALASAHEMSAIMEAYWNLSAKRFVDNCCMISDKEILGVLPDAIQDQMYQFIKDESKLESLFTESPEVFKRKLELEEKKDRLTQAASKLESISTSSLK